MKDVVIIGGGLAGLTAAWRLRDRDAVLLEAEGRVGGRIRSESRGQYFLNWGAHTFAGAGSCTEALLAEVGMEALEIAGSMQGISMNGRFIPRGAVATYPLRVPMDLRSRLATVTAGAKVLAGVARYARLLRPRSGESPEDRQQRILDFENQRSFRDLLGARLPRDARSLFEVTVTRSGGTLEDISAGCGIGYFSLVLGLGGLHRVIDGGPGLLTDALADAAGDRIRLDARALELRTASDHVEVRYERQDAEHTVRARTAVLATTADVAHQLGSDLPAEVRGALSQIRYGPHVSTAFLTDESGPQPWDRNYAIATPKRSFAIVLNQANLIRDRETTRGRGGSLMVFSPGRLGTELLDLGDEEVQRRHLADLAAVLGPELPDLVIEARTARWPVGSPYCFPGRAALQPALRRGAPRVFLAGDYTGTLYTESAVASAMTASRRAVELLEAEHAAPPPLAPRP
jgi:protoporphyrinogen/coproporphyrinogen III oxidase